MDGSHEKRDSPGHEDQHSEDGKACRPSPGEKAIPVVGIRPLAYTVYEIVPYIPGSVKKHGNHRHEAVPEGDQLPSSEYEGGHGHERNQKVKPEVCTAIESRHFEHRPEKQQHHKKRQRHCGCSSIFKFGYPAGEFSFKFDRPYGVYNIQNRGRSHEQIRKNRKILKISETACGYGAVISQLENHAHPGVKDHNSDDDV